MMLFVQGEAEVIDTSFPFKGKKNFLRFTVKANAPKKIILINPTMMSNLQHNTGKNNRT